MPARSGFCSVVAIEECDRCIAPRERLQGLKPSLRRVPWAGAEEEISRTAESIHQEAVFKASRKRVYEALTDTKQFDKVIQLSGIMQSMPPGGKATEISREVGGGFALFGGYITGRHIELVPDERIVQARRGGSWGPGGYSISQVELAGQGSGAHSV